MAARALAAVLLICLLVPVAPANVELKCRIVTADVVNVREKPCVDAKIVGQLKKGEKVTGSASPGLAMCSTPERHSMAACPTLSAVLCACAAGEPNRQLAAGEAVRIRVGAYQGKEGAGRLGGFRLPG